MVQTDRSLEPMVVLAVAVAKKAMKVVLSNKQEVYLAATAMTVETGEPTTTLLVVVEVVLGVLEATGLLLQEVMVAMGVIILPSWERTMVTMVGLLLVVAVVYPSQV